MQRENITRPSPGYLILSFLFALLLAATLGSLSQSHVNLVAIAELTNGISTSDWLATYWFDLLNFAPILALILLPTMLLVLIAVLQRFVLLKLHSRAGSFFIFLFTVFIFYVELSIINYVAPMPTLIAANRTLIGTLALLVSSGLGAILLALLITHKTRSQK